MEVGPKLQFSHGHNCCGAACQSGPLVWQTMKMIHSGLLWLLITKCYPQSGLQTSIWAREQLGLSSGLIPLRTKYEVTDLLLETGLEWGVMVFAGLSAIFWLIASRLPKNAEEMTSLGGKVLGVIVYRDFKDMAKAGRWNKFAAIFAGFAVIAQIWLNFVG